MYCHALRTEVAGDPDGLVRGIGDHGGGFGRAPALDEVVASRGVETPCQQVQSQRRRRTDAEVVQPGTQQFGGDSMPGGDGAEVRIGPGAGLGCGSEASRCGSEDGIATGIELLDERPDVAQGQPGAAGDDQMGFTPTDDVLCIAVTEIGCREVDHDLLGVRGRVEADPDIASGRHRGHGFHPCAGAVGASEMAPEVSDRVELPERALPTRDVGGKALRVLLRGVAPPGPDRVEQQGWGDIPAALEHAPERGEVAGVEVS